MALIVTRRPDAVTNAQFYAEDGTVTFADIYNHGFLATLLVPQSGYYQSLPVVVAGVARLLPLVWAPLAMNLVAIAVRALPVCLLLGERARTISPDVRVRALLAILYIALPGFPDADANMDNALWYLAVAAVIVLMLAPPIRRRGRLFDGAILLACATTGVFTIALAPLALVYRRWRPAGVPLWSVGILGVGAVLQIASLLYLQYHLPAGFDVVPRISVPLHASPQLFLQILGGRVMLPALFGYSLSFGEWPALLAGTVAVVLALVAFRRATAEARLFLAFAALLLAMALAHPQGTNWPALAGGEDPGRYFLIPELAVVATLVWALGAARRLSAARLMIAVLLVIAAVVIPTEWSYAPYVPTNFAARAARFERSPPGTRMVFVISPASWTMTLVKR
jgi:hypothetical protein